MIVSLFIIFDFSVFLILLHRGSERTIVLFMLYVWNT